MFRTMPSALGTPLVRAPRGAPDVTPRGRGRADTAPPLHWLNCLIMIMIIIMMIIRMIIVSSSSSSSSSNNNSSNNKP